MSDGVTGFDEESGFEYAQHDLATGKHRVAYAP
jgi:hypothetical protein